MCPGVTIEGDVDVGDRRFSPGREINRMLREDLGSATVTSTPKRAVWPIYSKRRSNVLRESDEPTCKAVGFDVASGSGAVGGVGLSKEGISALSEGVSESVMTSGGFSTLEGIVRRQTDEGFGGTRMGGGGEGTVRIPPVDEMLGQEVAAKERTRYYPSQSAKSLLKECFEKNPPTQLDPSHPTTSFSADQMIQFARAVGLEVSLASYSMLEDLLLKSKGAVEPRLRLHGILQESHHSRVFQDRQWVIVLLLGRFILCQLSLRLRVRMLWWVEMLLKNRVLADRQTLGWLSELKVLKNRELTV